MERLRKFVPTDRMTVPELKKTDRHQQAIVSEREAQLIERKLSLKSYLMVLDEEGWQCTSSKLASFLEELISRRTLEVSFLVGGHLGIPQRIKRLASLKFSLSQLTLPHELARVVLLEQVYRSVTIIKGLPYHK